VDIEQLKQIFAQAAAMPASAERGAFLDQACRDDAVLREQVEEMLAAQSDLGDFLQPTVEADAMNGGTDLIGRDIGPYKILQAIGEGGFGVVYLAEQELPVRRKVALKIIKAGMDTKQVIARFEAERQALALMEHPHIARVLDAGTTEPQSPIANQKSQIPSGRPYFVMELVKGIPITEFCDRRKLNTKERLQLFIKVCQAVQHAHQKGIIHRDLKPSNVMITMVDGEPIPKVIDFGVAKAMDQKLTEHTIFTRFDQLIGTPAYMSPEQAELSGVDVDTRSDIYSLGILLYQLLTGEPPIDEETLRQAGLDEIRRLIREVDAPKPSTRLQSLGQKLPTIAERRSVEPSVLFHSIQGDLDWITMKCLEKSRNRRYETTKELADDVQRHIFHQPVAARKRSQTYVFLKFLRRHRTRTSLTTVLTLLAASLFLLGKQSKSAQSLRNAIQMTELRNQELEVISRYMDSNPVGEHEKERFISSLSTLAKRIKDENGNRFDHELAANFLARTVRLLGSPIQQMGNASLDLSCASGGPYSLEGVGAVISSTVVFDGRRISLTNAPFYVPGPASSGVSGSVGRHLSIENLITSPGIYEVSINLKVQLVHTKPKMPAANNINLEDFTLIGNPIFIPARVERKLFVHTLPESFPFELNESGVAESLLDDAKVIELQISQYDPRQPLTMIKLQFEFSLLDRIMPLAIQMDLVMTNTTTINAQLGGFSVDEHGVFKSVDIASSAKSVGGSTYVSQEGRVTLEGNFRMPIPFTSVLPMDGSIPGGYLVLRSSREIANAAGLARFLHVAEVVKNVPIAIKP
jgi:serine/threonine protein kinase